MSKNIREIEGIGPQYAEVLKQHGIDTTDKLLEAGCDSSGRKELAGKTSINESSILKWVNMCDLFRIKGVAGQFAELLEGSGVDTVKELRNRNAKNLALQMSEVNEAKRLCKATPSEKIVAIWIQQAKSMEPRVSH
jgi:predicted flap endonuclease-1-like 5' DNA nuclease